LALADFASLVASIWTSLTKGPTLIAASSSLVATLPLMRRFEIVTPLMSWVSSKAVSEEDGSSA